MASLFSKIIKGEIPSYKIAENELFYAFLDIEPLQKGHTLIVPKQEVDKFYDADQVYLAEWLLFAQPIIRAIEKSVPCLRVGLSFVGLEVPHAHMHLVPLNTMRDMDFTRKTGKASAEELEHVQQLICSHL